MRRRIPLALAWRTGALGRTQARRVALANHPGELVAVEGAVNESKGGHGPEAWALTEDRCGCARALVALAANYRLTSQLPAQHQHQP